MADNIILLIPVPPPVNLVTPRQSINLVMRSAGSVRAYLNSLPSYANDEAARLAGLTDYDHYWFSEETDAGIYNTLKRVSPLT